MVGKNPATAFQDQANEAVEMALAGQQQVSDFFTAGMGEYIGEGAPGSVAEVIENIAGMTGQMPADAINSYYQRFGTTMSKISKDANKQLLRDNPKDIAASKTAKYFDKELTKSLDNYTTRLMDTSRTFSNRLRSLPAETEAAFTRTEKNPAFNTLRDENFKSAVQNPWVTSDISKSASDQYRRMWTYNV
jgi:hypothetical protein